MIVKLIKNVLATTYLLFILCLYIPSNSNAEHEGSHSKHDHEGSHSGHSHEGSHSQHDHEGSHTKPHKEGSGTKADMQAMMEKWKEYATPGKQHAQLNTLEGKWKHEVKWWMSPNDKPEISQGTSEIRWIMGGRFLQHKVEGVAMEQPFTGMGIIGYDKVKNEYNSIWIDSMGTGIMQGAGQFDATENTLSEEGLFTCPFSGKTRFRAITKIVDTDHYTYVMYSPNLTDGKEYKSMEITYSREK